MCQSGDVLEPASVKGVASYRWLNAVFSTFELRSVHPGPTARLAVLVSLDQDRDYVLLERLDPAVDRSSRATGRPGGEGRRFLRCMEESQLEMAPRFAQSPEPPAHRILGFIPPLRVGAERGLPVVAAKVAPSNRVH